MTDFDLIIKNGTVVTAADKTDCEIGIREGRIVAMSERLDSAEQIVDAKGKLILAGGVDSHVHTRSTEPRPATGDAS